MTVALFVVLTTWKAAPTTHRAVPHFSLPRLTGGGRVGIPADGGGNGRPAILLFFASWCVPCHEEIPTLARLYDRQHARRSRLDRVALIGVDVNDPTPNALAFTRDNGVRFPVGADRYFAVTSSKFGYSTLPDAVFVEGNGTIAGTHAGPLSVASFVSWERKLLAAA